MIVDIHTHCHISDDGGVWPAFRGQCRANGVALALISSDGHKSHFPDRDEVRLANDNARAFAENSNGLVRWLVYLNPQNDNWREEIERGRARGAVGVKLWIALKDAAGSLANTAAVIRYAGQNKLPVLVHTFQRTEPNLPGEITLAELADLAERCPETTLIGAHAGGNWRQAIGILRDRAPNVYVDISGSFPESGMVAALVRDIGAHRILFGSDLMGRSLASQLAKVFFAEIPDREKELILWKNAVTVFNLKTLPPDLPPQIQTPVAWPDFSEDHFCFCGRWPFFETAGGDASELDGLLAGAEIERAYAADLGSIYRLDLEKANACFFETTHGLSRIAPLATLNPRAHNWPQVLLSLKRQYAGAIIHPYLHNWRLDDPRHADFFLSCAARQVPLWINCALGDDRFRHSGLCCRPVAAAELIRFASQAPGNAYVFQGLASGAIAAFLEQFPHNSRFRLDISRLTDQTGALPRIAAKHGWSRLALGSEFPLRDIHEVRWVALQEMYSINIQQEIK